MDKRQKTEFMVRAHYFELAPIPKTDDWMLTYIKGSSRYSRPYSRKHIARNSATHLSSRLDMGGGDEAYTRILEKWHMPHRKPTWGRHSTYRDTVFHRSIEAKVALKNAARDAGVTKGAFIEILMEKNDLKKVQ